MHIVQSIIALKAEDGEGDLEVHVWEWLEKLLQQLGSEGTSSDSSSIEDFETIYRVKALVWRRSVGDYMDIIDRQRHLDEDIFSPQGSKPIKRVRAEGNGVSTRSPVKGLPRALYNDQWFQQNCSRLTLNVSHDQFRWLNILAR